MLSQIQLFNTNGSLRVDQTVVFILTPKQDEMTKVAKLRPELLILELPVGQKGNKTISLERTSAFKNNTKFVERHHSGNRQINNLDIVHYSGKVLGAKNSIVSLSIYNNEILALISFDNQNWNLRKNRTTDNYDLFHDDGITRIHNFSICESTNEDDWHASNQSDHFKTQKSSPAISTVDLYIECDYQMFTDFGSNVTNTLNYATSLLNTVNSLYSMSNIHLNVTQIDVWSTPDPYDANNADSSGDVLNAYKCELDGVYNGRIAHLLSTTNHFGGIANRRDYCPYEEPLYGFSRIFTSFNTDLSLYSWSVNVVAHEIGHNLSSPHTHSCAWNGNSTQIDDCANVYSTSNNNDSDCDGVIDNIEEAAGSDCFDISNPIIPVKGTIMSYCHISSSGNGVDLSLGFDPQVATKMKDYIDNCLSPTTIMYCPMPHEADLIVSSPEPNQLELTCTITSGIDGYAWYIKPDYSCSNDTTIISTSNTLIYYDDSTLGSDYIIKCLLNCDTGPEWGEWSCEVKVKAPKCYTNRYLSGIQSDVLKSEKASNLIQSTESIQDNSRISYQFGNETQLMPGFEVQESSIFEVLVISCL